MATGSTDALPRLADALTDVGERLRHISDELRAIHETSAGLLPDQVSAVPAGAVPGTPAGAPPGHLPGHGRHPTDSATSAALGQDPGTHPGQHAGPAASAVPGQVSGTHPGHGPHPASPLSDHVPGTHPGQHAGPATSAAPGQDPGTHPGHGPHPASPLPGHVPGTHPGHGRHAGPAASTPPGQLPGLHPTPLPGQPPADPTAAPGQLPGTQPGHGPHPVDSTSTLSGHAPGAHPGHGPQTTAGPTAGALPHQQAAAAAAAAWQGQGGAQGQVPWYPPPPVLPPRLARPSLWDRLGADGAGSRLLAWAGGVVTIAGVVLLLVLAIQRGILGPLPRVVLGAGLALALVGVGLRLHRSPAARVGASALVATGVAGLYLDVIAATTLHEFLPPWAGLATGLAVAGLGIAVASRWDSQQLAVFVVVCCAVSAPILTQGFDALLLGFLLVLTAATAPVHLRRHWPWLALASGVPPVVAELVRAGPAADGGTEVTVTAILTTAALVGVATVAALRADDDQTFVLLLISPLPAVIGGSVLTDALLPGVAAVLLGGVWTLRTRLPQRFALAAGGLATVTAIQATATALGGDVRTLTLLGAGLALGALAVRLRDTTVLLPAAAFGGIGFLLALDTPTPPAALFQPEDTAPTFGPGGLLVAATAVTLGWAAHRLGAATRPLLITAAAVTLYGAATAVLSVGLLISPDRTGFLVGHTLVTVSWTVAALVLLIRGIDRVAARIAGLSLVGAALAKLVLFDLSSLDGLARVAAFLVAGLVLLGAGTRYARLVAGRTD